jgi:hypothetical protein
LEYLFLPQSIIQKFSLNEDECQFFEELWKQARILPYPFTINRSSVYAPFCVYIGNWGYVGTVRLYNDPPKYAVMKEGNKRATRLFLAEKEALDFSANLPNSRVEIRLPKDERFMQILHGKYQNLAMPGDTIETIRNRMLENIVDGELEIIQGVDLKGYISKIPEWIFYCRSALIPLHQIMLK